MSQTYVGLVRSERGQPGQATAQLGAIDLVGRRPVRRHQELEERRDHRLLVVDLVGRQLIAVLDEGARVPDQMVTQTEFAEQWTEVEGEEVVASEFVVPVEDAGRSGPITLAEQEPREPREVVEPHGGLVDAVVVDCAVRVDEVLADELLIPGERLVQLLPVAPAAGADLLQE